MNRAVHRFSWRILAENNLDLPEAHPLIEIAAREIAGLVAAELAARETAFSEDSGSFLSREKVQYPREHPAGLYPALEGRISAALAHASRMKPHLPVLVRVLVEENSHFAHESWGFFLIEKGSGAPPGQRVVEIYLYSEGSQAGSTL